MAPGIQEITSVGADCTTGLTVTQSDQQIDLSFATTGGGPANFYLSTANGTEPLRFTGEFTVSASNQPAVWALSEPEHGSDEAREAARSLLYDFLDVEQREEFERVGHFDVHVERPDGSVVRYRIRGNNGIWRIGDDGASIATFCLHPPIGFPRGDVALTQKLLIETDELEFLRLANFQSGQAEVAREVVELVGA